LIERQQQQQAASSSSSKQQAAASSSRSRKNRIPDFAPNLRCITAELFSVSQLQPPTVS